MYIQENMTSLKINGEISFFQENQDLILFLEEIGLKFQSKIDELLEQRKVKKDVLDKLESVDDIIEFLSKNGNDSNEEWSIEDLPKRVQNRFIDAGDVSPADLEQLEQCLNSSPDLLQGIQVRKDHPN